MNILFLSAFLPSINADSAGVLDAAWLLKDLSREHKVILICNYSKGDKKVIDEVKNLCYKSYFIRNRSFDNKLFYLLKTFASFFSKYPAVVKMTVSYKFKSTLKCVLKNERVDLVIFEFTQSMIFLDYIKDKVKTLVDESDIAFIRRQRYINNNFRGILKKILIIDNNKLRKYELKYLNKIDSILIRTKKDKELLIKHGINHSENQFHIFLPWINFESSKNVKNSFEDAKSIMFFGAMWRPVNKEAVLFFVKRIFPKILLENPSVKFYIVGSRPDNQLKSLSSENIVVTGYIDSIEEYYSKVSVVVVPILSGSGIKGKIIQSLGFGRPVVTTSVGAEGIDDQYKNFFYIKDNPTEFAEAVNYLLNYKFTSNYVDLIKHDIQEKYNWKNNFDRTHQFIKYI